MKVMSQKTTTVLKMSVLFTMIMVLLITLIPADASAASRVHETEDPNAELYPYPLDMNVLSKYQYGSEENVKGRVLTRYSREVPPEWLPRDMPDSLKNYGIIGRAVVHTTRARIYFYPGETSVNYHKKRIEELSQTAYAFQGTHPDGEANLAFYCAETTEFKVLAYNALWVAIWSEGGIDVSRGLGSACGGIGTEQYGSWKPGVYFIPRRNCYITDVRNQADIPEVTASGTATCNIYVKTTPASDNYVAAGLIESNQLFQIINTTPINGHYQIYFKQGFYYVNAHYVNLKLSTENKPIIQYNAVVTGEEPVNVTSEADASSSVEGIVKKDAKLQVVKKDYGNGYSQVWFNSKNCYIPTKSLDGFEAYTSLETIKKLGKAKGKLVLDSPWSGLGATVFTPEGLKLLKKRDMNQYYIPETEFNAINGTYRMEDGDSATVYGISKYTYVTEDYPDIKEKTKIYKLLFNGKICYITDQGNITFTYYPGNKYSKKVTEKTKMLWIYGDASNLESYNINGFDYFKLDDIAQMMAATNKSFDVKYDKADNAIIIHSMSPYKGKSAPMKKGNGKKHKASLPAISIVWDGEVLGIPCYKIDGNYYVTAHDIAWLTDSRIEDAHNGWRIMPTRPNKIDAVG